MLFICYSHVYTHGIFLNYYQNVYQYVYTFTHIKTKIIIWLSIFAVYKTLAPTRSTGLFLYYYCLVRTDTPS